MGETVLVVLWGALTVGGLLLFFWVLGQVIEWPEKFIRRLFAKKKAPPALPLPPADPQYHEHFDEPV